MASTSALPISCAAQGPPEIIRGSKFRKIFEELGEKGRKSLKSLKFNSQKGVKILNDNSTLINVVTKNVCALFVGIPVAGVCGVLLTFIIKSAADLIENEEKMKNLEKHAKLLKESTEIIANAGGDIEDLKTCLAMLSFEAFETENASVARLKKQGMAKRLFLAQLNAEWLDGLATKLKEMNDQLSLLCGIVNLEHTLAIENQNTVNLEHTLAIENQTTVISEHTLAIPKLSKAPLGDSSLKIPKKVEYLKFVSTRGIRVLCVCGMGGIGKTTLLKALYDEFPKVDKQAKAFVEVGRNPTNLMEIQRKILSQLKGKEEEFIDTEQGRNGLRDCIKGFKAGGTSLCLCIDNVWKADVLRELLPEDLHLHLPQWSCLMLSTREEVVADEFHNICCSTYPNPNASYELFRPKFMGGEEAEELFVRCAQIEDKEKERGLLNAIVPLCGGLPLALKTYGTYFKSPQKRTEIMWETVKQRILRANASPSQADGDEKVLRSLEPSIDIQTPQVQEAFVDAALFWRWKPLLTARCALYHDGEDILEVLLQGSIFYFYQEEDWEPILQCHDLFFAVAEKRATSNKWKYCQGDDLSLLQQGIEGIRAANFRHETLEFQTLQKNLSIKYLKGKTLTSTYQSYDIAKGPKHGAKALQVSYIAPSLLQVSISLSSLTKMIHV